MTAPRRVLIIKPSALGDVATAVPVLRGLRRTFPDAHIAWLVAESCQELIAHDSDLNEVIIFRRRLLGRAGRSIPATAALLRLLQQLRQGHFDWVIDLQGLLRSGLLGRVSGAHLRAGFADAREGAVLFYNREVKVPRSHTIDRNIALARALGVQATPEDMTLQIAPSARDFAARLAEGFGLAAKQFIAIVPPTTWPSKLYPVRHWRTVVQQLAHRCPVAIMGTPADVALCEQVASNQPGRVVNLAGLTTVPQFVATLAAASVCICPDSAAKFIAPAVGTSVVCLMGPTSPELTGPYRLGRTVISPLRCRGCLRRRCRHTTCMQSIAPADVVAAAIAEGSPSCLQAS